MANLIFIGEGSGGGSKDYYGPTYIVGNAPAGDSSDNVHYLDTGNGDALRQALAAASAMGGEVHVRRGVYALRPAGGGVTTVPASVKLVGEGDGTVLALPQSGVAYCLQVEGRIDDCTIGMVSQPDAPFDLTDPYFVLLSQTYASLYRCNIEVSANVNSAPNYTADFAIVRMQATFARLSECSIVGYSSSEFEAGGECIAVQEVGGACWVSECRFGTINKTLDVGVEIANTPMNEVSGCVFTRTQVRAVRIRLDSGTNVYDTKITGNRMYGISGVGIGLDWHTDGELRSTLVANNVLDCAANASTGISFDSPSAARLIDFLAVHSNVLYGRGTGTAIYVQESGGGAAMNVSVSLNLARDFTTAFDVLGTASTVGNLP